MPSSSARNGGTPLVDGELGHDDRAERHDRAAARSMPAVRMISVWPIASVPIDHHLLEDQREVLPLRNRSLWVVKKTQTSSSAISGPSGGEPLAR